MELPRRLKNDEVFDWLIDDHLYSAILRSLEQTHCARLWFNVSDKLFIARFLFVFWVQELLLITSLVVCIAVLIAFLTIIKSYEVQQISILQNVHCFTAAQTR